MTDSITYNKQTKFVDAGLFMGRSFRVGWGPGWTLAHCGDILQPSDEGKYLVVLGKLVYFVVSSFKYKPKKM